MTDGALGVTGAEVVAGAVGSNSDADGVGTGVGAVLAGALPLTSTSVPGGSAVPISAGRCGSKSAASGAPSGARGGNTKIGDFGAARKSPCWLFSSAALADVGEATDCRNEPEAAEGLARERSEVLPSWGMPEGPPTMVGVTGATVLVGGATAGRAGDCSAAAGLGWAVLDLRLAISHRLPCACADMPQR